LVIVLLLTIFAAQAAQAQFHVIFNFSGGSDGRFPFSGVVDDQRGNLYGTTFYGGAGYGVVFQLAPSGSGWILTPLYTFQAGNDGAYPVAGVTIGPDGALYGSTYGGGGSGCSFGCGTVFRLTPPPSACLTAICPWNETVLYRFLGGTNGQAPQSGVTFDQAGNLYGTTPLGGLSGNGTVYELVHSNGMWTESLLYGFAGGNDGGSPQAGVTFDSAGNLYGTTPAGGQYGLGTIYQLVSSGSGWTESVIYNLTGAADGVRPLGGVIFDTSGNLYATTSNGGSGNGGTVFELIPSGGSWNFNLIYSFFTFGTIGRGPVADLTLDAAGNLYGTTGGDGFYRNGTAFELVRSQGWNQVVFHSFIGPADGADPFSTLVFDAAGNLYGTAAEGGSHGDGVIYQITP